MLDSGCRATKPRPRTWFQGHQLGQRGVDEAIGRAAGGGHGGTLRPVWRPCPKPVDHLVGPYPIGDGVIGQLQAMAQHRVHGGAHIVRRNEVLPVEPGMCPRHPVQADAATGLAPMPDPAPQFGIVFCRVARR
jgi:hypothetical protein